MAIPFPSEWNDLIPFQPDWNELSIPTGLGIPIRPDWNATLLIILRNMRPAWGRWLYSDYNASLSSNWTEFDWTGTELGNLVSNQTS